MSRAESPEGRLLDTLTRLPVKQKKRRLLVRTITFLTVDVVQAKKDDEHDE
jgi:hypothetical protein